MCGSGVEEIFSKNREKEEREKENGRKAIEREIYFKKRSQGNLKEGRSSEKRREYVFVQQTGKLIGQSFQFNF